MLMGSPAVDAFAPPQKSPLGGPYPVDATPYCSVNAAFSELWIDGTRQILNWNKVLCILSYLRAP